MGLIKLYYPPKIVISVFQNNLTFWYHNLCKEGEDEMENKKEYRAREGNIK